MPESRESLPLGTHAGPAPAGVTFGPFRLDFHARKLWRGAERIQLPARAVDALAYLIAHRDRMVDKDEIISVVWRDVAVTDDSLIHAVSVIRRVLGDDPVRASFIETIPRRGYRFIGRVEEVEDAVERTSVGPPDATPSVAHAMRPEQTSPWGLWTIAAVALLLIAVAAAAVFRGRALSGDRNAAEVVTVRQVAPPGTTIVPGAAVSPAGGHLAFVALDDHTGRTALWIRALDGAEPLRLPGTEGASKPFFSPDGQIVAFFRNGQLMATDLRGARIRTISPVHGPPAGGSWGADDVIVFAEWMTGLYAVAAAGGAVSPLTRLDHTALDVAHAWPQFLPDGRRFLYHVLSQDSTRAGVYIASLDSRDGTRLLDDVSAAAYVPPGFLLYLQHDRLMAEPLDITRLRFGGRPVVLASGVASPSLADGNVLSASRDLLAFWAGATEQQLTWVDRSGVPRGTLDVPTSMFNFRVSPDGRYVLAASSLTDSTGVWLVDLAGRTSTQLAADGIAALWSPDGSRLAFTSRAGLDLHVRSSSGTGRAEPLASDQSVKVLNDWSLAAQAIIYTRHDFETKLDLWHQPLSGGPAQPLVNTAANEAQARLSPDGRWIAYVSDHAGSQEVFVRRYPELDAPRQASTGGGGQPQWRADQQELFYLSPDRSLMAVTVTSRGELSFGAPRRLFRASIAEGPSGARESYAAMPDGRSFLIDARRDTSQPAPITVIRHWATGLTSPLPGSPAGHNQ
jgi:DNA-binding winged helix-turn-helix (wHTH) protein/Tol biopolymer transport system component